MKQNIDIETKTFIRFWLVVIGFGLVGFAIYKALPALVIVGFALFLAIALNPSVSFIAKKLSIKSRVISTAIAYVAVVLILGGIIFLVVPPVVEQTTKFARTVPSLVDSATNQYSGVKKFVKKYNLQTQFNEVTNNIKSGATKYVSGIGNVIISSIGSVLSVIITVVVILAMTFLMLVEGPIWVNRFWDLYKDKPRMLRHRETIQKMYSVVTSYVTGQLTVSAIDGVLAGVVVFILSMVFGIPANLAIPTAAVMFILSLIPLFGATIGALIMGLILLLNSPTAALIFLIYFFVYQQVENNFISPKIQSKRLNLSSLVVLVSITIGIMVFGIVGGIISIPIAGCVKILLDNFFRNQKTKIKLTLTQ